MSVSNLDRRRFLPLKERIAEHFTSGEWIEISILTNSADMVERHPRLLRSLRFGDDDYEACVLNVLTSIVTENERNFSIIENYVDNKFPREAINVSSNPEPKNL